ncbi:GTP cyclohydrolase II [Microbotryomycetes sp. JL221]|nr:GTP cyclohydrolase II [Microbotryomycetes sp. JL221]
MLHTAQHHSFSPLDLSVLKMLTADSNQSYGQQPRSKRQGQRRPHVDPLMVAAAASAGPDVTRNHYLHEYFPHAHAYESCDQSDSPSSVSQQQAVNRTKETQPTQYKSQQAPRTVRLAQEQAQRHQQRHEQATNSSSSAQPTATKAELDSHSTALRRSSVSDPAAIKLLRNHALASSPPTSLPAVSPRSKPVQLNAPTSNVSTPAYSGAAAATSSSATTLPPLQIKCQVRTRIPTPHGHVFLYLYTNNHDDKEHLAFVADQAQMDDTDPLNNIYGPAQRPYLRSTSLDSSWRSDETEMERIVRGAYVGKLSASSIHVAPASVSSSTPSSSSMAVASSSNESEPPLVRIHSECFTGETIGSQRCDCGEQLDEAFRLITLHKRGVIVYLRQEGRGIGLLEKMRAYNLQDLGHDTVTANLMLGHGADMRTYDIAGAILRDLQVNEIRLLTNNPDKIEQIEREGVKVVERVAMIPRAWVPVASRQSNGTATTDGKRRRKRRVPRISGTTLLHQATEAILASQQASMTASSEDDDGSFDDEYDEDDDDDDVSSEESDASLNLRRSGVGMIGAATTKSPELEKYLRTKIERMGHMLEAPKTLTTSVAPVVKQHKKSKPATRPDMLRRRTTSEPHPLSSSVVSIAETDQGSVECGSECEECQAGIETQSSGGENLQS